MILICTGGRDHPPFRPQYELQFLNRLYKLFVFTEGITNINAFHGAARGADTEFHQWALSKGIPVRCFPVRSTDWDTFGKRAGRLRNEKMITEAQQIENDIRVVAFPGGRGTEHMVCLSIDRGLTVYKYTNL